MSADPATPAGRTDPAWAAEVPALAQDALSGAAAGPPVPSGFPGLDNLLGGGFRRGDLVVLGGDTGSGKSALALAITLRAAAAGLQAAVLSGEMTVGRLVERTLAMLGRVAIDELRGRQLDEAAHAAVAAAALELRRRAPVFDHLPDRGVAGVSDFLAEHLGLDLVTVDPLQYLVLGRLPLDEEVAAATRALKELAIRRSTTVLAVAQIGGVAAAGRADRRPRLDDFGGLGAIRQHADVVLGLFREELYDSHPQIRGAAELHVLKNRNGPTGFVDLYFYQEWLRFEDMVEPGT
jgi:replicative DNA helicase